MVARVGGGFLFKLAGAAMTKLNASVCVCVFQGEERPEVCPPDPGFQAEALDFVCVFYVVLSVDADVWGFCCFVLGFLHLCVSAHVFYILQSVCAQPYVSCLNIQSA